MKKILSLTLILSALLLPMYSYAQLGSFFGPAKSPAEQRQDILTKNQAVLKQLYKAQPNAKDLIEKSAGYATFSNFGMKILIAGGGTGSGVVINKINPKPIYMNMAEVQAG